MLFSILVPVYNVEKYLHKCLESIIGQACQDFEVILVDDGSTDQSGFICDVFAQRHSDKVTVIHKKNEGLISARRVGVKAAKGQYCIFLDSDDFLDLKCLEVLRQKIEKFDAPDMMIYRFSYYEDGKEQKCKYKDLGQDSLFQGEGKQILYRHMLEGSQLNSIWTKAIKTDILKKDPTNYEQYYDKSMSEDLLQSLYPITEAQQILYISEPLYFYRYNRESISRNYKLETASKKNTLHVYQEMLQYLSKWGMDTKENRTVLKVRWMNETAYYIENYFNAAHSIKSKIAVLKYSWDKYVDCTVEERDVYNDNQIWSLYIGRHYCRLYLCLTKRQINRRIKQWKRKHFNSRQVR